MLRQFGGADRQATTGESCRFVQLPSLPGDRDRLSVILTRTDKGFVEPLRRQFVQRCAEPFLPPLATFGKIGLFKATFEHFLAAAFKHDNIKRKIDRGAADAGAVERQRANFQRQLHCISVFQRAIQNGFAVARLADDAIRRSGANFHPISLRVEQIELVFAVVFHLAADQRIKIKCELAVFQRFFIFRGDSPGLRRQSIDGFMQAIEFGGGFVQRFFKVSNDFVANAAQAGSHHEQRMSGVLKDNKFRAVMHSAPEVIRVSAIPTNPPCTFMPRQNVIELTPCCVAAAPATGTLRKKRGLNGFAHQVQFSLKAIDEFVQAMLDDVANLSVIQFRAKLAQTPFCLVAKRGRRRAGDRA